MFPAKRDELKYCCEALMLENQCRLSLVKEAVLLRAKIVETEKTKTLVKGTPFKGKGINGPIFAEKCVNALEEELRVVQDAQKQIIKAAKESEKRAKHYCCSACSILQTDCKG